MSLRFSTRHENRRMIFEINHESLTDLIIIMAQSFIVHAEDD